MISWLLISDKIDEKQRLGVTQIEDAFVTQTIASNVIPLRPMLCLLPIWYFDYIFSD